MHVKNKCSYLLLLLNLGCAAITSKGQLPEINLEKTTHAKASITLRVYSNLHADSDLNAETGLFLKSKTNLQQDLENSLNESGYFSLVKVQKLQFDSFSLLGKDISAEKEIALNIKFPVETDYFLDIESTETYYGTHGYMYLGLLHGLTLGFFPIYWDNKVNFSAKLYDKSGKLIDTQIIKDLSTTWAWTPLYFFNGFNLFPNRSNDTRQPIIKNSTNHLLKNMKF